MSNSKSHKLISINDIPDPGSKGLKVDAGQSQINLFVVKKDGQISVFENSCPHTLGPLDWLPDQFLDTDNQYIMCANHGALFEINSGLCIYGPCKQQSLKALPFSIENYILYLSIN
jgi:nitrite reductase/ring-hydroxylating ferredoxin subunit